MATATINRPYLIREEPAHMEIGNGRGAEIKPVAHRFFSDGSEVFACRNCDRTFDGLRSACSHQNAHRTEPRAPRSRKAEMAQPEALEPMWAEIKATIELAQEAASWKARALSAESRLKALRRAFAKDA